MAGTGIIPRLRAALGLQKSSGILPSSYPVGWFQQGMDPMPQGNSRGGAAVEACVAAYAQTISQLPIKHYAILDNGTRSEIKGSVPARLFHRPNQFQTRSDFILNLIYGLLYEGNAYWVGEGGTARRPEAIYLLDPRQTRAELLGQTREVFYATGGSFVELMEEDMPSRFRIPERYVGHVRLFTPRDPLIGVTPITAAASSVSAFNSITGYQSTFFANRSRPSGVLSTDMDLTRDQMQALRQAWEAQAKSLNSGGVPILAGGLKWSPMALTNADAELIAAWKMTIQDIARVFRVPPMIIGDMGQATFDNAETLMSFWLSSGLGFVVNHIEQAMERFFDLPRNETIEIDTQALLRTDLQARLEALGVGVTKGIFSPNEARKREGLPPVPGGDMPRVQQQMVPLDWEQPEPTQAPAALPAPEPEPEDEPQAAPEEERAQPMDLAVAARKILAKTAAKTAREKA